MYMNTPTTPKKKILIFEDDTFLTGMYETKFKLDGLDVATYNNPSKDPVSIVLKEKPDAISMNIVMPKMDGFTAIQLLKADTRTKDIPIIVLSSCGQQDDINKGLALGAIEYFVKSQHSPSEIVNRFRQILGLPQHIPAPKEANKTLLRSDPEFIPPLSGAPKKPVKKPTSKVLPKKLLQWILFLPLGYLILYLSQFIVYAGLSFFFYWVKGLSSLWSVIISLGLATPIFAIIVLIFYGAVIGASNLSPKRTAYWILAAIYLTFSFRSVLQYCSVGQIPETATTVTIQLPCLIYLIIFLLQAGIIISLGIMKNKKATN